MIFLFSPQNLSFACPNREIFREKIAIQNSILLGTTNEERLQLFTEFGRGFKNELGTFKKDKWYRLKISQRENYFDVHVDGIQKIHVKNNNRREEFKKVNIYAGDEYHDEANVEIRNFYVCSGKFPITSINCHFLVTLDTSQKLGT